MPASAEPTLRAVPRDVLARLAKTSALGWLALRFVAAMLGVVHFSLLGVAFATGLVLAVTWLDIARSGERMLLANLAVSPTVISSAVFVVALGLELFAGLVLAALVPAAPGAPLF